MSWDRLERISRRRFLHDTLIVATATQFFPGLERTLLAEGIPDVAHIRGDGSSAKVTTLALRRNLSVLSGVGGNIIVLPGSDGKVLVDVGYATSQRQIAEALNAISSDPPRHLIYTHWHFDHTDGNGWLNAAGATIIAHENTRKRLSARQEIPAFHGIFPPSAAGALPTEVFSNERSFGFNGEEIRLQHHPPAHSDSDISVRFVEADVLHTGDTCFNGFYPFIDYHNGGTLDGMLTASARNLSGVDDKTIIVPGHGAVGDKRNLAEYDEMMRTVREKVAVLKRQGRSVSETVAAKPSAEFDQKWGGGWIGPKTFVELVYRGVQDGDAV
jgi:glyoxylase-like metal-dependent hydrolase (beta-lactamase superfamily II)